MTQCSTPLTELVVTGAAVAATASRREKIALVATLLRRAPAHDARLAVNYLAGEIPQGRLNIPSTALSLALSATVNSTATLSLSELDQAFAELLAIRGTGAAARREARLAQLFARVGASERDFIVRLIRGELRQGAAAGVMLEAVAQAAKVTVADLRRAAMRAGDLATVAAAALAEGAGALTQFKIQPMQPVQPMLAQAADEIESVLTAGEMALEHKLDGVRVQAHKLGDDVRLYTRALKDITASAPEIVQVVRALPAHALILDGEALAISADGRPQPFQTTMRRFGRRQDDAEVRAQLPLAAAFFDCLYYNGDDVSEQPGCDRHAALTLAVPEPLRVPRLVTADLAQAREFARAALARGHEGIMAKSLTAPYAAGQRGAAWYKLKPAHTLDLVVIAAEWGNGRRRGWLSNLHLGARDAANGTFVMLGKTFKGMTDTMLAWQTEKLKSLQMSSDDTTVYVRPELVVEIAFNDVQASPHYPAGFALRFARVKRYRGDKSPAQADTIESVRALFAAQRGAQARHDAVRLEADAARA